MAPSARYLKASLALWRRRHAFRLDRLSAAHAANDGKRVRKWYALLAEAGRNVRHRQAQLAKLEHPPISGQRSRAVALLFQVARAYARDPNPWHYLAGGIPSLICLVPSPWDRRSDCSQFAANIDREAGISKPPGSGTYLYSNTDTIKNGRILAGPKVGAYGLYGTRFHTHHVERCVSVSPLQFVGHGTKAIDSLTPGLPSFYVDTEAP